MRIKISKKQWEEAGRQGKWITSQAQGVCKYCGNTESDPGSGICLWCWNLEYHMSHKPELAKLILDKIVGGKETKEASFRARISKVSTIVDKGSQKREMLADTDYELDYRVSPTEVILKNKDNPGLPHELWVLRDDYAGYVIEIDGKGYEFATQVSAPHSGPLKGKKWGIL